MDQIINIIFIAISAILVLFAPGFFVSLILFNFGKIDFLERIALSFALSISIIPLLTFYLNLLGLKINTHLIISEILAVANICTLIYLFLHFKKKKAK